MSRQKESGKSPCRSFEKIGGDEGDRTPDLSIANAALSQLSYIPENKKFKVPGSKFQVRECSKRTLNLQLRTLSLYCTPAGRSEPFGSEAKA